MIRVHPSAARYGGTGALAFDYLARRLEQAAPHTGPDVDLFVAPHPPARTLVHRRDTEAARGLAHSLHDAGVHDLGAADGGIWATDLAGRLVCRVDLPAQAPEAAAAALGAGLARRLAEEPSGSEHARPATDHTTALVDVWHEVPLVPQITGMSCWAAAAAMIVGWRDCLPADPESVARGAGRWREYQVGLLPDDLHSLCATWGLVAEPVQPLRLPRVAELLRAHGPLWIGEADPGLHVVVITGLRSDGTDAATRLRIADPWPVGRGERYEIAFDEFAQNFSAVVRLAGQPARILHARGGTGPRYVSRSTTRV